MIIKNDNGLRPRVGETSKNGHTKRMLVFVIISMSCFVAMGVCAVVDFAITGGFSWSLYPILSIAFAWLLCTPLLTKSNSLAKWIFPPTMLILPYLFLLGRVSPITGWLVGVSIPLAALSIIALWVCFFVSKKLTYNSWYLSAALIFIIGSVVSPITTLLSVNFVGMEFLISDFVSSLISLVVIISMLSCLMVAGILFGVGYTERNFYSSKMAFSANKNLS